MICGTGMPYEQAWRLNSPLSLLPFDFSNDALSTHLLLTWALWACLSLQCFFSHRNWLRLVLFRCFFSRFSLSLTVSFFWLLNLLQMYIYDEWILWLALKLLQSLFSLSNLLFSRVVLLMTFLFISGSYLVIALLQINLSSPQRRIKLEIHANLPTANFIDPIIPYLLPPSIAICSDNLLI